MLVAGVDEAGKGPVLGPLVVACVVMDEHALHELERLGVRDSKRLSARRRARLADRIKEMADVHILALSPREIDAMRERTTMNWVMVHCFSDVLVRARADVAYVDAADVSEERFAERVMHCLLERGCPTRVIALHRADVHIPVVSAASIVAKVHRDTAIGELTRTYGKIGSGYPSDPSTISFLRDWIAEHHTLPACARASWSTCARLMKETRFRARGE